MSQPQDVFTSTSIPAPPIPATSLPAVIPISQPNGVEQKGQPNDAHPSVSLSADAVWDAATKRTVLLILLGVALFVVWLSQPVIELLIFAGMLAYLVNPFVDLAQRVRIPRAVTTTTLFVLLFVGILLIPIIFIPILVQQLTVLSQFNVVSTAVALFNWVNATIRHLPETVSFFGFEISTAFFAQQAQKTIQEIQFIPTVADILSYVQQLLSTTTSLVGTTAVFGFSFVGGVVQVVFSALVIFFLSLYITKDLPTIRQYVEELFPKSYQPEFREVLRRMGSIWQAFFRGQLILCLVIGTSTWLALTAIGMPGALVLAIVAGVLEIIPSIGPTVATVPAVLVALMQGSEVLAYYGVSNVNFALITIGVYFIIQQVESSILVPRIIGSSVSLHPVVVICGVVVGLNTAGILGAFLAAPLIASFRVLGSYIHAKLLDYPPFQEPLPKNRRRTRYRRTIKGDALATASRSLEESQATLEIQAVSQ